MRDPSVIVIAIVLAAIAVRAFIRSSGGLGVIRETAFAARNDRPRPMKEIGAYWRLSRDPGSGIDDRTWDDLDLDAVFASIDHTASAVGQQQLFARLRDGGSGVVADLESLNATADHLAAHDDQRRVIARALRRLDDVRALGLTTLLFEDLPGRPAYWWLFPLLSIGAAVSLVAIDAHPRCFFVLLGIAIANVGFGLALKGRIDPIASAFRMMAELIRAARLLSTLRCDELDDHLTVIRENLDAVRPLKLATGWLAFEPGQANELVSTLYEYVNLLLGLNLNAFAFAIEGVRARRVELRAIYESVGAIDVALSLSRWRSSLGAWVRPEFTERRKAFEIRGLVHPLVPGAVANALVVDGHSILVTGSNMSGKTTFIRAVAINAILAQSLDTALATQWRSPCLNIRSSIGRSDDVLSGKSYYLAEVESIGRLVATARDGVQHLYVIDEIFRGTNTTERVAGGRAVLAWLDQSDNIVLVATHDLELLGLLEGRYEPFHFREQVAGEELLFDYTIRPGISSTRNAIALLRLMRFPEALVQDAMETAGRIDRTPPSLARQSP
jgi:hypothetical protein